MAPILVDGVYEHLVGYRDTILKHHRWLCGDEIGPSAATDSWQIYAGNMATTLRNYARLLEALSNGTLGFNGPVVFPSWDVEREPSADELLASLKEMVDAFIANTSSPGSYDARLHRASELLLRAVEAGEDASK